MTPRPLLVLLPLLLVAALACKSETGTGAGPAPSPKPTTTATGKPKPGYPASMAALGDSISAAVGTCLALLPCPAESWSTGDSSRVNSHYQRILAANPAIRGHQHNYAVSGAVAADMAAQARKAVSAKVAYVTLLIGANDACRNKIGDMTSVTRFRSQVNAALAVLKKGLPNARVLVLSVPDVYQVWQVAHTNKTARLVWGFGVCPALLANPTSTSTADTQRRAQFRDRINGYDAQLASACAAYGARCRWDGGTAHAFKFSIGDLSDLDFFHPSAAGQNELAKLTYPGSFTW